MDNVVVIEDPAQQALLELIVMHGGAREMVDILSELHISPRRFTTWMDDDAFRGRLMSLMARREEMHLPEFVAVLRKRGMDPTLKNSHQFAKLYLDLMGDMFRREPVENPATTTPALPGASEVDPKDIDLVTDGEFEL